MTTHSVADLLKKDTIYTRIRNLYRTATAAVDTEALYKEVESLHASRASRSLRSKAVTPKSLTQAITTDMANRARLVEIKTTCSRSKYLIEQAVSTARSHLRANYTDELKADYGNTAAEVNAGIDLLLSRFIRFESTINTLVADIDFHIKDIDQAGYGLRNLVDVMKLVLNNNANIEVT